MAAPTFNAAAPSGTYAALAPENTLVANAPTVALPSDQQVKVQPNYAASGVSVVSGTFTGTAQSASFIPIAGRPFNINGIATVALVGVSVQLERSFNAGTNWSPLTAAGIQMCKWNVAFSEGWEEDEVSVIYRLNCTAYTSGTLTYRISQ